MFNGIMKLDSILALKLNLGIGEVSGNGNFNHITDNHSIDIIINISIDGIGHPSILPDCF